MQSQQKASHQHEALLNLLLQLLECLATLRPRCNPARREQSHRWVFLSSSIQTEIQLKPSDLYTSFIKKSSLILQVFLDKDAKINTFAHITRVLISRLITFFSTVNLENVLSQLADNCNRGGINLNLSDIVIMLENNYFLALLGYSDSPLLKEMISDNFH